LRLLVAHAEARVLNLEPFAEQRLAMRRNPKFAPKESEVFVSTCNGRACEQAAFGYPKIVNDKGRYHTQSGAGKGILPL